MSDFLQMKVEFLKGVGAQRAELLGKELEIFTVADLISHFPNRYEDRSRIFKIHEVQASDIYIQVSGILGGGKLVGAGRAKRYIVKLKDLTGEIELVWFQSIPWMQQNLKTGEKYLVYGRLQHFNGVANIVHPEMELLSGDPLLKGRGLTPVYPLTETLRKRRLDSRFLATTLRAAIEDARFRIDEILPDGILKKHGFLGREQAIRWLHLPRDQNELESAQKRIKFEEFFYLQMRYLQLKNTRKRNFRGFIFEKVGAAVNDFYHGHLPFALTGAQKKVIKEIHRDMKSGKQMNRLLQGDVGSGKTIVALISMLIAADNGYQSCLMAPTEILANQHASGLRELLGDMPVRIELLTGSTKKKQKAEYMEALQRGEIHILVGTHALIEEDVAFQKLGLVVIDEQHRFGVAQRAKMWEKSATVPHVLVMTATPIPRTLAMTVYGDLDVSVIDEMPAGRKAIRTVHRYEQTRAAIMDFVKEEIAKGRQVYVVFPLIEDSPKLELKSLMTGYDLITYFLPTPEYKYSMVHGRMKGADKEGEMQKFKQQQTQILVATTVIEVGVNVPNASVMIIENTERFGLAQLHQLRGRVGRGAEQSFCVLVTGPKLSENARKRLNTMVRTNDGFEIAKVDLELRGPGDMDGTRQSGLLELKLGDILKDEELLLLARTEAESILDADPGLNTPANSMITRELAKIPHRTIWSKIS